MSIFAERIADTELLDLPIETLRKVEWDYMDLYDFSSEFNNEILLQRLADVFKDVKENHIFHKLFDIGNLLEDSTLEFITDNLIEIGYPEFSINGSIFYDGRQLPREYVEKHASRIDMYNIERQGWIDPEFFEKYEDRMDVGAFWNVFGEYRTFEDMKVWFTFEDGKYVQTMMEHGVCNKVTAAQFTEIGLPVPECYNTVITAQRIMSGDPCNDGQRSFAIWLRKYRRVYNDPDGFPTWDNLIELCQKHPRMNNDGYVDWIHSRALFNSEQVVSTYPTELGINVRRIDDDDYAREVRNTSDDNPDVIVPEFRPSTEAVDVTGSATTPTMNIRGRTPQHVQVRFMDAPVGTFSPEMISIMSGDVTPETPPEVARSIEERQMMNRSNRQQGQIFQLREPRIGILGSDFASNQLIHPTYINAVLGTEGLVTPSMISNWVEDARLHLLNDSLLDTLRDLHDEPDCDEDDGGDESATNDEPDDPEE